MNTEQTSKNIFTYILFLNLICNLQQLRIFYNDFFNLVLVFKDTEGLGQEVSLQLFE